MVVTSREVFTKTAELARDSSIPGLATYLLLVGLGVVVDAELYGWEASNLLTFVISIISLIAQYQLTRAALSSGGCEPVAAFGSFFILGIVLTIAIGLGFLALVVPGVVLVVRWSASIPALLAEDLSVGEALSRSWDQTRESFWSLLQVFGILWVPALLAMGLAFFTSPIGVPSPMSALASNLVFNGAVIGGWFAAVAVYLLTAQRHTIADVFA